MVIRELNAENRAPNASSRDELDYRELVNALPVIAWTCDRSGQIEWISDRWLELTGMTREQSRTNDAVLLPVHPDDRAAIQATYARAVAEERLCEFEYRIRTRDGVYRYHMGRMAPIRGTDGAVKRWLGTAFDIHERHLAEDALRAAERARATSEEALRESEARAWAHASELDALMDTVPAVVLIARDPECRVVSCNRTGREVLRSAPDQNISKTALEPAELPFKVLFNGVEIAPQELPLQRAARGIDVSDHEETIVFDDGHAVHLFGRAVPLRDPDGTPRGAVGVFVDVTRLKRAEASLLEADRRKDEFLAFLSHELRNPLAPIITAAQLMQLRGEVATQREREIILRHGQHLVRLVDDLLEASRVARGMVTLSRKPVELATILERATEATEPLFARRNHRLTQSVQVEGLVVEADEVRLTQVVSNLLTNAAHYTPSGGNVELRVERDGKEVVLRVRDDGMGIEPSLLPHVFEMFVRGNNGSRSYGGLGLGLSLVRMLTELHGGSVHAESRGAGQGSEFTVRLPVLAFGREERVAAGAGLEAPEACSRQRILIVDDNQDGADLIAEILNEAGHQTRVAYDASRAMAVADEFHPQLAILDIGLPVIDGYALGRLLKAQHGASAPTLIALTGFGRAQGDERGREFAGYLVKPVDANVLLRLIDELVSQAVPG